MKYRSTAILFLACAIIALLAHILSRLISVYWFILIVQFNVTASNTPENWIKAYFSWLFVLASSQNFLHQNNNMPFILNIIR